MSDNFVVAHCRKVQTTVGLGNVAGHNSRVHVYDGQGALLPDPPDWLTRPDRAHLNKGDMLPPEVVLKRRGDRIRAAEASNLADGQKWRRPQKNASAGIEVAVSASPEWFEGKSTTAIRAYFDDAKEYLARRFGRENIIQAVQHWDEKTPHMHLIVVPILSTEKGLKYSSSEFLGGRHGLRDFQTEIAEAVGKKHGLTRGVEGSRARHTDQYEWAADTAATAERLAAKEKELAEREAKVARLEKAASVKVPPFAPKLEKKKLTSAFLVYRLSDGKEASGWEAYATAETTIQAATYAKRVEEVARAAQVKATRYEEAATKTLPAVQNQLMEAIEERNGIVERLNALTPSQLRTMAKEREDKAQALKIRREARGQGELEM